MIIFTLNWIGEPESTLESLEGAFTVLKNDKTLSLSLKLCLEELKRLNNLLFNWGLFSSHSNHNKMPCHQVLIDPMMPMESTYYSGIYFKVISNKKEYL